MIPRNGIPTSGCLPGFSLQPGNITWALGQGLLFPFLTGSGRSDDNLWPAIVPGLTKLVGKRHMILREFMRHDSWFDVSIWERKHGPVRDSVLSKLSL
jgi:hypothetical protein